MTKRLSILVLVLLTGVGLAAKAGKEAGTGTCPKGQQRWHGTVTRSNKDGKTITVRRRGGQVERVLHYTDDTKWTSMNKPSEMTEIKDGDDVITCSEAKEKGTLYLTRVDKRSQ